MRSSTVYYLFTGSVHLGMVVIVTAYAPFLLSIGLSLGEIALINAVFWGVLMFAEVPTGMFADGRGRAWSLMMGAVFCGIGALAYAFATGLWSAILAEALIGIGGAFISGAQQAWIADALTRENRLDELRKVYANASIISGVTSLLGGAFGAGLALLGYRLIWIPMIITSFMAAALAYRSMNGNGEPLERITKLEALKKSVNLLRTNWSLIWIVAVTVLFAGVLPFNHYWAPYFQESVGQMELAAIWAVMYFGFTVSGVLVRKLTVAVGHETNWIIASMLLTGLGLAFIPVVGGLVFPVAMVVVHEFGRGMLLPLSDSFVQHRVESSYRATFGSLQSFVGNIGRVAVPLAVWFSIGGKPDSIETISLVWIVSGAVMVVGTLALWFARPNGKA